MSSGEKLRELRDDKDKSLSEAAHELGVSKSALAMYERNERVPRDEVKVRIADYYHKTVQEIFFEPNEHI